jgi:DNA-binding transcriptional regulator YiaG
MNIPSKEDIIRLKSEDKTDKAIAALYGLTPDYVVYLKEKYNLPKEKPGRKRKIKITRAALIELQNELRVDRLIAERIGITSASVAALRRQLDIPMLHKGLKEKIDQHETEGPIKFLYQRIVEVRHERKIKQYDFAKMLSISPAYLRRTEHGIIFPPLKLLLNILNVLEMNPNYLFLEWETKKFL